VLVYVRANPKVTTCQVGIQIGILNNVARKILNKYKIYTYRPDLLGQYLCEENIGRKITFIVWLVTRLKENLVIFNFILWINESKFTYNGIINKRNNRYRVNPNAHAILKANNQIVRGTNA